MQYIYDIKFGMLPLRENEISLRNGMAVLRACAGVHLGRNTACSHFSRVFKSLKPSTLREIVDFSSTPHFSHLNTTDNRYICIKCTV